MFTAMSTFEEQLETLRGERFKKFSVLFGLTVKPDMLERLHPLPLQSSPSFSDLAKRSQATQESTSDADSPDSVSSSPELQWAQNDETSDRAGWTQIAKSEVANPVEKMEPGIHLISGTYIGACDVVCIHHED